jgi:hypothetical protein
MLLDFVKALAKIRVTVVYAATLVGVAVALAVLGPRVQDRVISHASTNLHNLSHGHVGTLFVSAFVIDAGPIYVWLPGLMCLMGLAELMWRSRRLVVAFVVGHLGATLLVAVGLTAAVELAWLSAAEVTRATDVGMSYGASAVLGSLTAAVPRRGRPAWIGWWLAAAVAVIVVGRDFTDAGHAAALVLGMLASTQFGRPAAWTPMRCLLLVPGVGFGYLMLANTGLTLVGATGAGVVGALVAEVAIGRRMVRPPTPEPADAEGALTPGIA